MRIPKYWARAEGDTPPDVESAHRVAVWGWSDESRSLAERHAQQRLTELLDRLRAGRGWPKGYGYGERPPREQILDVLRGDDGDVDAVITRNSYGSTVLNSARVMFVDVDVPPSGGGSLIGRLFGSRKPRPEDVILENIREALRNDSGGSYRIYRTAAGFRVLATDPLFSPGSTQAERLMTALGADQAFVQLCRRQESFRARLSPKPWRCGQPHPPSAFPREHPDDEAAFAAWLESYEHAARDRATCRFVETVGGGRTHPAAVPIVRLHDERTKASSELPLA